MQTKSPWGDYLYITEPKKLIPTGSSRQLDTNKLSHWFKKRHGVHSLAATRNLSVASATCYI